ncbi:MAG TPA: hypothetical protein VJ787_11435 [Thermoleophilia bacterium]|nr:hypothetical protein [Thermoleophilia bacterium]
MSRGRDLVIAAASFAVAATALVLGATQQWSGQATISGDPVSVGEWIYRTGTDPGGRPIPSSGGMMMRVGCAGCHGRDGRGLSTPMFRAPDITYANLTDPKGMLEADGVRGPTFTDADIRRAVTQGIDPEGDTLAWHMPRWQFTDVEWRNLLAYLKTLR